MKILTGAAAFFVGAFMASQSARAQFTPNDLYMGFENQAGGGSADYIINLGDVYDLIDSSAPVINLSSDFSLSDFTSSQLEGTNSTTIMGGAVAASNGDHPSDLFVTELRVGGAGTPWIPGSTAPTALTRSADNLAYSSLAAINAPASGMGLLDPSLSWETYVEPTYTSTSFYGNTGVNPDSSVSQSSVLYEDVWETSNGNLSGTEPFTYEGYLTLDINGDDATLTFTTVPEPSSCLLSCAGGILVLLLRNRMRQQKRSS